MERMWGLDDIHLWGIVDGLNGSRPRDIFHVCFLLGCKSFQFHSMQFHHPIFLPPSTNSISLLLTMSIAQRGA